MLDDIDEEMHITRAISSPHFAQIYPATSSDLAAEG